jgi:hypothetical protein
MNVTLPEGLMGDPNQMLDQATGTNPQQKTGTGKP